LRSNRRANLKKSALGTKIVSSNSRATRREKIQTTKNLEIGMKNN